jgi:hypothetical protein
MFRMDFCDIWRRKYGKVLYASKLDVGSQFSAVCVKNVHFYMRCKSKLTTFIKVAHYTQKNWLTVRHRTMQVHNSDLNVLSTINI